MVEKKLLEILVCPENHSPLREASAEEVQAMNEKITAGNAKNRKGDSVTEPIDEGLIREDGQYLYPVRDSIPVMLIDEAIALKA